MKHLRIFILTVVILIAAVSGSTNEELLYRNERNDLLELRDSLRSAVNLHSNWTGPPCYNSRSRWFGITCRNLSVVGIALEGIQLTGSLRPTALQNVTHLRKLSLRDNAIHGELPSLEGLIHLREVSFSGNRFSGPIPGDFTSLARLTRLELQDNLLNGTIPPFDQQSLTEFNVSYNFLRGQLPETSVMLRFPESSFDHNSELCGKLVNNPCAVVVAPPIGRQVPPRPSRGTPSPSIRHLNKKRKKGLKLWSVALIAVGAALVPFMALFSLYVYKRHRKTKCDGEHSEMSSRFINKAMKELGSPAEPEEGTELEFFNQEKAVFNLNCLYRSSAEVIGKGKLGITYKVTIESGLVVIVKRMRNMSGVSRKEFVQQLQLFGRLRHENIAEIISYHYSKEEKLVIYEHIPGASLFQLLHDNRGEGRIPLKWATRLSIVKGIARGLAYLHQCLPFQNVPHANLKSSNVLILHTHHLHNKNYLLKLTDYGFQPLLPHMHKLAIAKSPEYSHNRKLTNKADVFCFGLLLLEVVTGRVPGDEEEDLSSWVRLAVRNEWSTDILDLEIMAEKESHGEMLKLVEIAFECTDHEAEKRPRMNDVVRRIEDIKEGKSERKDLIIEI
ncbi:putative leucine-rich repeat receptor-like protein kinase [Ananas comosus]|uniref:Putative leucine-rich repeat receptor-like protein kinase n=1 Tax=Ananas comosus TaxID=4615 RepID=A0A199VLE8_ANACO|nr:putative leucine-rich repeat receptor-like protein kinase [Ananas comosus]